MAPSTSRVTLMREHDAASPPRVALVFFGLFRAPSQTLDSVTRHVIAPLRRAGALVEVYLHSYNDTRRLHNPRAGEHNLTWRFDWELVRAALRPKAFVLSDQKADLRWLQDHTLRSSAGLAQAAMVDDAGSSISSAAISLRNWLAELNSKDRASWLWEATDRLTSVLCLRADVRVIDDVDVPLLLVPRPNTIYAPFWHRWDGLNDRLAFGTPDVMRVYLRSSTPQLRKPARVLPGSEEHASGHESNSPAFFLGVDWAAERSHCFALAGCSPKASFCGTCSVTVSLPDTRKCAYSAFAPLARSLPSTGAWIGATSRWKVEAAQERGAKNHWAARA